MGCRGGLALSRHGTSYLCLNVIKRHDTQRGGNMTHNEGRSTTNSHSGRNAPGHARWLPGLCAQEPTSHTHGSAMVTVFAERSHP